MFRRIHLIQNNSFLVVSKPLKYNNNADTFLLLLLLTTGQRENVFGKTLFVSAGAQKGEKQ